MYAMSKFRGDEAVLTLYKYFSTGSQFKMCKKIKNTIYPIEIWLELGDDNSLWPNIPIFRINLNMDGNNYWNRVHGGAKVIK
jgi:hypothetical protein